MTAHVLPRLHEPRRLRNPFVSAQEEVQTAEPLLFSDSALYALLIPIIIEQFLNALMGMADTMMISNLGRARGHLQDPLHEWKVAEQVCN